MNHLKRATLGGGTAMLVLAGGLYAAIAHEGASGIVKERMDAMEKMGGAMKQIGLMMKGIMPYDGAAVSQAAMVINQTSAGLEKLFPRGGDEKGSYTKPELWDNWDEFKLLTKATGEASEKLSEAAFDGTKKEVLPLFFGVGKSCKACHTKYRRAKDNE